MQGGCEVSYKFIDIFFTFLRHIIKNVQFLYKVLFCMVAALVQSQAVPCPEQKSTSMFVIFVNSQTVSSPVKVVI